MTPGDICWVRVKASVGGDEADCRRPAVIIQAAEVSGALPTLVVVPLTLEVEALRLPGTVAVEPDRENGLTRSLVALVFQLTAVDAALVEPTAGRLSAPTLEALWTELDRLTGRT